MDSFYDLPSIGFFSPDQHHELSTHDLIYDSPWTDPLETFLQEKPSGLSVHDHARGCSYLVTFPKNCAFLRMGSIHCMIEAYEAQKDDYQTYCDTAETVDEGQPYSSLEALPHDLTGPASPPLQNCDFCDAFLDVDSICAAYVFAGSEFPNAQNQQQGWGPGLQAFYSIDPSLTQLHIISMQAYSSGAQPMKLGPNVDYSVAEAPPGYATYPQQSYDYLHRTSQKTSQWECNCIPLQSYRQASLAHWNEGLVSNDLGHNHAYPSSLTTVGGGHPLNFLV